MIPLFKVNTSPEAPAAVARVLESGMTGEGPEVKLFTSSLQKRFGTDNVVATNSCTSAMVMALKLAGVGHGDLVISTPYTMVATNMAIISVGAHIVWADVTYDDLLLDRHSIESLFLGLGRKAKKVKAIVATAVGGLYPAGLDMFGIPVILDCAHAVGTVVNDIHISARYDFSCFSFQSIKQLSTGDGGALVFKDNNLKERANNMKWFGISRNAPEGVSRLAHQMEADILEPGYKFHMNDIAAAIGNANIANLDSNISIARKQAARYTGEFSHMGFLPPYVPEYIKPSWWLYWIRVPNRDKFIEHMISKGISVSRMWRLNYEYSVFGRQKALCKKAELAAREVVFIPIGPWLSDDNVDYILEAAGSSV